jgi:hypothetical protein
MNSDNFYTASQARERLGGMSAEELRRLVEAGKIQKFTPPTNKVKGYYNKMDVDNIAQEMQNPIPDTERFNNRQSNEKIQPFVDWIGVDDVLTSLQLDYRVYGPEVFLADLQYYADRVKRNPHVALAIFDSPKKERILAYISLLPLSEPVILEILSGKRHETRIENEEVETYEHKGGFTLLAESVVVDPEHTNQLNRLLNHLLQYWCEQYPDRYVTKIYAQAESRAGDVLIQKLFFAPREDLAPNAYVLNLERPGASRFVKQFQKCIEEKRKVPSAK